MTRNLVFYATIEHYRWWLATDGIILQVIETSKKLSVDSMECIARAYYVVRGIKDDNKARQQLVILINSSLSKWPAALADRAQHCSDLAKRAKEAGLTHDELASAMTKLVWFIYPSGWTMFDRFAADGLGVRKILKSTCRMAAFYDELQEKGFVEEEAKASTRIGISELKQLHGSRVIDKFLMLKGFDDDRRNSTIRDCKYFLSLVPTEERMRLESLASDMQRSFGKSLLHQSTEIE